MSICAYRAILRHTSLLGGSSSLARSFTPTIESPPSVFAGGDISRELLRARRGYSVLALGEASLWIPLGPSPRSQAPANRTSAQMRRAAQGCINDTTVASVVHIRSICSTVLCFTQEHPEIPLTFCP